MRFIIFTLFYLAAGYTASVYADISQTEKQTIDKWIKSNHLNKYGDPLKSTIYYGGSPLWLGGYKDRYDYIERNHPKKPWNEDK